MLRDASLRRNGTGIPSPAARCGLTRCPAGELGWLREARVLDAAGEDVDDSAPERVPSRQVAGGGDMDDADE
jgi:hypothetical protein